jgi:hypothetical protein
VSELNIQWKKFATEDLSIMLPDSFIGGNPKKDKKRIKEELELVPENHRPRIQAILSNTACPFIAADTIVDDSFTFYTTLAITFDKLPLLQRSMSMEKYLVEAKKRIGKTVIFAEEGTSATKNYSAARLVIFNRETKGIFKKPGEINQKILVYSIKTRTRFWDFFFGATPGKFEELLPVFELCIDSVVLNVD